MKKFKVIHDREALSSSEITGRMNFNNFISGYTPAANIFLSMKSLVIIGVSTLTAVIVTIVLMQSPLKQAALSGPFIVPPIPQLNIQPTDLIVSGNRDTVINYPSGTKLFIPANAFTYANNTPAAGPFRIRFREFHDQVDQMLSGIPMICDSAGVKKQFESAGMFDVMGFEGDDPVYIKEGKELVVDMPTHDLRNNFNVYYLDTVQKKWNYDIDNSENNILLLAGLDTMLHRKYGAGFETMVFPEKADPLLDNLIIDFDKNEFPELGLFDSVKFQFVDKSNYNKDGSKSTWEDVHIQRQNNRQYLITFTKGKMKQSYTTIPVLDKKDFDASFAEYDKVRVIRLAKFKSITDSLNNLRKKYDADEVRNRNVNAGINNLIHRGEFISALNEYADKESMDLMTKHGTLSRMVAIRRFGIFNFDCLSSPWAGSGGIVKDSETKNAHCFAENSKTELAIKESFLIKKDFNGIYALGNGSFYKFTAKSIAESDILIIVTPKKEMFFIKDEEFKATDCSKTELKFVMHKAPEEIKSAIDLRRHFNM